MPVLCSWRVPAWRVLIGSVAAALLAAISSGAVRAQMLDRLWFRYAPDCASYAISPDGSVVVDSDWDGTVIAQGEDGRVQWQTRFPSKVRCVLSDRGENTAVYAPGSASANVLTVLNARGEVIRRETLPGPIRSLVMSEDGHTIAALSEPGRLTVFQQDRRGWRWKRRSDLGNVTSMAMDASGTFLVLARQNPSEVALYTRGLQRRWSWRSQGKEAYRVVMDRSGQTIAALTLPRPGGVARAIVWSASDSRPAWTRTLRGDLPAISLSQDGRYLVAGYRTRLWHGKKSVVEPRVMLFSPQGRGLWEVGGLMFGAHLIGAAGPPLVVLTHDNSRVLAVLDHEGHMRARYRLASPIISSQQSADGTHIAVRSYAGLLYLFRTRR